MSPSHHLHSSLPGRAGVLRVALAAVLGLAAGPLAAAEPPPAAPTGFVIHLRNGGFVNGAPPHPAPPGGFPWRSPAFADPPELEAGGGNPVHPLRAPGLPQ